MLAVFCGLMAFLGHIFPVYLAFRGGKGVATGLGVALALNWEAALIALGVWFLVLLVSRFVALASMIAGIALPVAHGFLAEKPFDPASSLPVTIFLILGGFLVLVRHLGNLSRILRGVESKDLAGRK